MLSARSGAKTPPEPPHRVVFLDNLRVFLCLCVAGYHSSLSFWPYEKIWPAFEPLSTAAMGAFFFIGGYFTPDSLARKGTRNYCRDRLIRLGLPALAWGAMMMCLIREVYFAQMWFAVDLLVFNLLYAWWRRSRNPPSPDTMPGDGTIAAFLLGIAALSSLLRLGSPVGQMDRALGFVPVLTANLAQFLAFFLLGAWASRTGWLKKCPRAQGIRWLMIGFAALAAALFYTMKAPESWLIRGGFHWVNPLNALLGTFLCFPLAFGFLVVFRDDADKSTPVLRSLVRNSYGIYFVNILVIMKLQKLLPFREWPESPARALAVFVAGILISWAISEYVLCRLPLLRKIFPMYDRPGS